MSDELRDKLENDFKAMSAAFEALSLERDIFRDALLVQNENLVKATANYNRINEEKNNLNEQVEQLRVQLAGCGVAALQNTEYSKKDRAKKGVYGWSQSYQDVCDAVDREIEYRAAAEKLAEALEFYSHKKSYSMIDEGRNYNVEYVCYELNPQTYNDDELGTLAKKALAEYREKFPKVKK
jgi:di/tripeptidase